MSLWTSIKAALTHLARPKPGYVNDAERQQFDADCIRVLGYKGDELVMLNEHDLFKIWRAGAQRALAQVAEPAVLSAEPPLRQVS